MPVYFVASGPDSAELVSIESRIRGAIPHLQKADNVKELLAGGRAAADSGEKSFLIVPIVPHDQTSFERVVSIASQNPASLFFIIVSQDISAADYKQLLRTGSGDWASLRGAEQEILEIIERNSRHARAPETAENHKPVLVSFLPSAGGVGNATLALEAAVQLKTGKSTRNRTVCVLDLDFQASHICDLLDIEARLQIEELSRHPERLDAQLFAQYVSHHSSGVDVLAAPRGKDVPGNLDVAVLDVLFGMISQRYNHIIVDLPVTWFDWTRQILSVSDAVIITGLINIPSLRQVAETLAATRATNPMPPQIAVALNRAKRRLLRGVAGEPYVARMLAGETIFYVRDDPEAATQSMNTGIPMAVANLSSVTSKDIARLTSFISGLAAREAD